MSTFPRLKTNSVCQYPTERTTEFATSIFRFVDGSEQRFRNYATPLKSWGIELTLLDDVEMAKIEEFVAEQQGQYGSFSFTDPWDQATYTCCKIDNPEVVFRYEGPQNGRTSIIVRENRG